MILELTTSISAHGDEINQIELRDPTGKDVREIGYPYQMNQDESVKILAGVVAKYITRLGNIPPSAVDSMSPADLNTAGWAVVGFFLQA